MLALYVYNLPIFVLHNIVFNVLSDNKNCCYKIVVMSERIVSVRIPCKLRWTTVIYPPPPRIHFVGCILCLGSGGGLRLTLNVEQYEYMPGPHSGAGIKMLLHNSYDVAMVKDLGVSIPPGMHACAGISIVKVSIISYVIPNDV